MKAYDLEIMLGIFYYNSTTKPCIICGWYLLGNLLGNVQRPFNDALSLLGSYFNENFGFLCYFNLLVLFFFMRFIYVHWNENLGGFSHLGCAGPEILGPWHGTAWPTFI